MASIWSAAATPQADLDYLTKSNAWLPDRRLDAFLSSDSHCKTQYYETPEKGIPCMHAYLPFIGFFLYVESWLCQGSMWLTSSNAGNAEQQRCISGHFNFLPNLPLLLLLFCCCFFFFFFWLPSNPACAPLPLTVIWSKQCYPIRVWQ